MQTLHVHRFNIMQALHVQPHMTLLGESFATDGAGERLFTSVDPRVSEHCCSALEQLAAYCTSLIRHHSGDSTCQAVNSTIRYNT